MSDEAALEILFNNFVMLLKWWLSKTGLVKFGYKWIIRVKKP